MVCEINLPAREAQVVQRELHWLASRFVGRWPQALLNVVDVKPSVAQVRQRQHRRVDLDGVGHRRQPQQGLQLCIYIETLDADLGRAGGRRGLFGDGQITDGEFERPRLEVDGAYRDLPTQLFRRNFLRLRFEQRRHRQPGERPKQQQRSDQPCGTLKPPAPS